MKRGIAYLATALGLCLTNPLPLAAQQNSGIDDINALVNEAFGKLTDMNEVYFDIRGRLVDWENSLPRFSSAARPGDDQLQNDDFRALAETIVNHPMVAGSDVQCRGNLGTLLLPGNIINQDALVTCARAVVPRVRYSTDMECSSLFWAPDSTGKLRLTGHVKDAQDRAGLVQTFGAETVSTVVERPFPACAALEALELPMSSQDRPGIRMLANKSRIAYDESLAFEVTTPDFYSFLYVVYLQADGSIVNLMPKRSLLREQQRPGTRIRFGDGRQGRQTYTASAPPGSEAIIAVASRSPIDQLDRLEQGRNGQYARRGQEIVDQSVFLDILRESLEDEFDAARGRREISADVFHLTVVP